MVTRYALGKTTNVIPADFELWIKIRRIIRDLAPEIR